VDARRPITPAFSENAVALIMPLDGITRAKERLAGGVARNTNKDSYSRCFASFRDGWLRGFYCELFHTYHDWLALRFVARLVLCAALSPRYPPAEAIAMIDYRHVARAVVLAGVLLTPASKCLAADDWPTRTVKIIVPFSAGSTNDISARLYADGLSKRWGKPAVVENKAGADAIVGGGAFANARDDHTLLFGTASMITVNPLLQEALPYDPSRDMIPISSAASSIFVVAVHDHLPARSLQELAQLVRSKPGQLLWSSGPSLPHFVFAAMLKRNLLKAVYVPYRDGTSQQADFGEGRVHILSQALQGVKGPVDAGNARILAVMSPKREPALPDVPTVAEAGFPEMEMEGLLGLFGWRDMPQALRDRISADMQAISGDPSVRSRIEAAGQHVLGSSPAGFAAAIERQRMRIEQISGIVDLRNAAK
jgi:tripartite-type tricarboxylate transporter receptor subunit TctC